MEICKAPTLWLKALALHLHFAHGLFCLYYFHFHTWLELVKISTLIKVMKTGMTVYSLQVRRVYSHAKFWKSHLTLSVNLQFYLSNIPLPLK